MACARWIRLALSTAVGVATAVGAGPPVAAAKLNVVSGVVAAEKGGATVVTIAGSETATFTSYKLARPDRLAIEVARCRLQGVASPIDVASFAVGQIAVTAGAGQGGRVCRVLIGLRRAASYTVRTVGQKVVVRVVPHEAPPATRMVDRRRAAGAPQDGAAAQDRARARVLRQEAERVRAAAEQERQHAEKSRRRLERLTAQAEQSVRASAARQRVADAAAVAAESRRAAAERAAAAADARRQEAATALAAAERRRQAVEAEQQRLRRAKRESREVQERVTAARREVEAARQLAERAQANARRAARETAAQRQAAKQAAADAARWHRSAAQARRERDQVRAEVRRAQAEMKQARAEAAQIRREAATLKAQAQKERQGAAAALAEAQVARQRAQASRESAEVAAAKLAAIRQEAAAEGHKAAQARAAATAARSAAAAARQRADEAVRVAALARTRAEEGRQQAEALRRRAEQAAARARTVRQQEEARSEAVRAAAMEVDARRREAEATLEEQRRRIAAAAAARKAEEARAQALRTAVAEVEARRQELTAAVREQERRMAAAHAARRVEEQRQRSVTRAVEEAEQRRQVASAAAKRLTVQATAARAARVHEEALADAARQARGLAEQRRHEAERAVTRAEEARTRADRAATVAQQRRAEAQAARERLAQARRESRQRAAIARAEAAARRAATASRRAASEAQRLGRLQQAASAALTMRQRARAEAQVAVARVEERHQAAEREARRLEALRSQVAVAARAADQQRTSAQAALRREQQALAAAAKEREAEERRRVAAGQSRRREEERLSVAEAARKREESLLSQSQHRRATEEQAQRGAEAGRRVAEARLRRAERASQVALAEAARAEKARAREEGRLRETQVARAAEERRLTDVRRALKEAESDLQRAVAARRARRAPPRPVAAAVPSRPAVGPAAGMVARGRGVTVHSIDFVDEPSRETVIIGVSGTAEFNLRQDGRRAVLRIARAGLMHGLPRALDTRRFLGPVRAVKSTRDAGGVTVVAELADDVQSRVRRQHGRLMWDFLKGTARRGAPAARTSEATREIPPPKFAPGGGRPRRIGPRRRRYTGKRIDLDFKDADIHNILRLLADIGHVNIITGEDVKGTVTIRMRNVPWDQALDVILRAKGLGMVREGNLVRVAPATVLEKERERELAARKAAHEVAPLETRLIPISYAEAQEVLEKVRELGSPRSRLSVDERTNTLIVTDVRGNLNLIEELARNLDSQTPQVLIESRIVEARSTFAREIGIQWGGNYLASSATGNPTGLVFPSTLGISGASATGDTELPGLGEAMTPNYAVSLPAPVGLGSGGAVGFTLGSISGAVNLNLRLSAMETSGTVRIVAAPRVTTLDNVEAIIEQGVSIPISQVSAAGVNTVFADAKLTLQVKPHITSDGNVKMKITVTKNEADFINTGARGDPTILRKQAKTEMLVRDGDTAVIGGIYTRNTGLSWKKVPFLAEIPIIGWAFKTRRTADERTEMLIFITPRIVNRARALGQ